MSSYRAGFIGLIGQPNAGKSSVLNFLVQEKVAIVTPKPQTTRRRVLGIVSKPEGQIVFVDAPGMVRAEKGINAFLQAEMESVIQNSDALLAVLPVDEASPDKINEILDVVKAAKKPWAVVITKTDLKDKTHRADIIRNIIDNKDISIFNLSTINDKDPERQEIMEALWKLVPEAPQPLYPDIELFTPHNIRDLVAEIVREKCFENLYQEVPYGIAVRIVKFEEPAEKDLYRIYAEILVTKESFKPIVIGKGASVIKKIGMDARLEMEKLVGAKVFLDLQVKVREDWNENKNILKELGYVTDAKE